jgi:outer membrane protein OmpA-like peptidoglycan-associated protein
MRKNCILALVFGLILSVSAYSQTDEKGSFYFSAGYYSGFFNNKTIPLFSNIELDEYLNIFKLGGSYEFPFGPGNVALGLEAGYASGSRFGGRGSVDFIPINLTGIYAFQLAKVFFIGPSLKLGGFGLLGSDWFKVVPLAGARLDAELRFPFLPLSLYGAGGLDIFPTALEFGTLPVVEVGIRFPRGTLRRSDTPSSGNKTSLTPVTGPEPDAATPSGQTDAVQRGQQGTSSSRQGLFRGVYFAPDTAVLLETSRSTLEEVGRQMAADPTLKLLLRAYTAPFGTASGREMVSRIRADFCRDYYIRNYGIEANRISSELYGSLREPEMHTNDWITYRCVELIIH